MMKNFACISKRLVIVFAAFCLPLAACSRAPGGGTDVNFSAGGAKGKAGSADWLNGGGKGGKGGKNGVAALYGGGGGGGGGGGKAHNDVKIPKIGGHFGKKKGKGV